MIKIKGVEFLLFCAEKFPEIKFIFIGDGPMRPVVEDFDRRLKNVSYIGRLSQSNKIELAKLVKYYSAADIFSTITTYNEGFGAVYLEAVACGTPVLASNLGSLSTFLDNSVSKLIDPVQEQVDKAVEELLIKNTKVLLKMQGRCRNFAEKEFSEKNAEVIYKSYYLS
jgi:glycosyltransferase involved in cell wall biosynthesis